MVTTLLTSLLALAGEPWGVSELVVLTVAALALACAAYAVRWPVAVAVAVRPSQGRREVPVLRGRVGDPGHHPHRPRAPGLR